MKDIYNKDKFLEQTAGSMDIAKQVADIYLKGYEKEVAEMKAAAENKDLEQLRRLAHKSKSGFLIMGSDPLYQIVLRMETLAKADDLKSFDQLDEFEKLSIELAKAIKQDFY